MNIPRWSVNNRVAANLLCIVVLAAGFLSATTRLKLDLFPDITTDFLSITVVDPATSSAEEIEKTITVPIEEEVIKVGGVNKMYSSSEDYFSNIFLEMDSGVGDISASLDEVRQAVDKARAKLPASIEAPVVENFDLPFPLVTFTASYPPGFDLHSFREKLVRLKRDLKMVAGVSDVLVDGLDDREIWIEIDPFRLQGLGVSYEEVAEAVRRKNKNVVGGRFDADGGQRVVRVLGEITDVGQLGEIPVKMQGGKVVLLQEVATFVDRSEEPRTLGQANLRPAVSFLIVKKKGADAVVTVEKCREVFSLAAKEFPPQVETQVVNDSTRFIRTRINTVFQNGVQALLLVTVLLVLFLDWRMAIVVAIGIPISFAGSFLVLYLGGYSINLLSLFGMIMALGMVVDDAVVISENSYRLIQQGKRAVEAAVEGTDEVFWPVLGSVSTTVAAFLPLIWGDGIIGKFLVIVPVVVISTLVFSLMQAFFVLPSHIADFVRKERSAEGILAEVPRGVFGKGLRVVRLTYAEMREAVDVFLSAVVEFYLHLLAISLRYRYFCVGIFFLVLVGAGVLVGVGAVPFKLFSTDFADVILVKVELPRDHSLEQTREVVARLEKRIVEVLPKDDLVALVTRIGARLDSRDQFLQYGTNLAMVTVDIDEENPRARRPSEISRDLRRLLLEFPEFISATAKVEEGGPPVGRAVNVEILGTDFPAMVAAAEKVEKRLKELPGALNVGSDFPAGKTELLVRVDDMRAARAGLDAQAVGAALQAGFRGIEAGRLRWGDEEVILRVKVAERFRNDPEVLFAYRVINREGKAVDLSSVAEIERSSGLPRINRLNSERVVTVSSDVDERVLTSVDANEKIRGWLPEILAEHPGCRVRLSGENEDTEKSLGAMKFASVVALLLIYALLAVITNSFFQPVVIMAVIPFGIVGVILGLLAMGEPIGLMSVMGTIALAGIVVNNSVVLVDFVNRRRHEGSGDAEANIRHQPFCVSRHLRWRSVMESGKVRFRPVFLTTATTVVGLMNLAFTSSGQEQFLAPMAQAIVFGLTFASLLTMVLIPCLYSVLDDIHLFIAGVLGKDLGKNGKVAP